MRQMIAALCLCASNVAALELTYQDSYTLNRPASLEYDPNFCGLWIANEGPEIILVTLQGEELRRFRSGLTRIKAVALEGDALLVADGLGGFQRLSKDGAPLADPFRVDMAFADTEGLAVTADGAIIMVEDDPERMTWLDRSGNVTRQINTRDLDPPLTEAQGIAIDPRTGHMLIVDDWEGTNSLYEFDAGGRLLGTVSLLPYGNDPEGVAIRPGSSEVFVAFDSGARIVSFDYKPTLPDEGVSLPNAADCLMF